MQWMDADGYCHRKTLPMLFRSAMELPHPPSGMKRHAQSVFPLEHQPMEARGVHAGEGVARRNLTGGDVGSGVDSEMQWDWQGSQIEIVAFYGDFLPGRFLDCLAWDVTLAALA